MSVRFSKFLHAAALTAGVVLVSAPAFAGTTTTTVPEPSSLTLLGSAIFIPGAVAWIKRKLS